MRIEQIPSSPLGAMPAVTAPQRHSILAWAIPLLLLVALTAAVFSPVLRHHFIEAWDDSTAILTNRDYNPPTWGKIARYWAIPPRSGTFFVPVTYTLWGVLAMVSRASAPPGLPFNPAYFYAANWVAHVLSVAMVFLILRRLVARPWAAAAGAAVFAFHPIQVEAVCFAWNVYTPLSAFFGFVAIWQYLIFAEQRRADPATPTRTRTRFHYFAALLAFVMGLLTKPTVVSVPLMIASIEFFLRGRPIREWFWPLLPWVALGPVFIALNLHANPAAATFVPDFTFRPLIPLDAIAFYLGKVFWPAGLVMDYGRSPQWVIGHPVAWLTGVIPLASGWVCWRLRGRIPWLAASFAVFVAGLLPTIGIVPFDFQRYSTVCDHYVYLAMLGVALAAACLVRQVSARWAVPATTAMLALLACLCIASIRQLANWQDDWHLASHTLQVNPDSKAAHAMFRYLFTRSGHLDPVDRPFPASSHCSLDEAALMRSGDLLRERRYWDLAAGLYGHAIEKDPRSAPAFAGLGATLLQGLEFERSAEACHQSLALDPSNALARDTLARLAHERATTSTSTAPSR